MVLFGALAAGAALWGALAGPEGLVAAFLIAAAVMVAGAATIGIWPLFATEGPDRDRGLAVFWPEPQLVPGFDPKSGPVVVTRIYTIAAENERAFQQGMSVVRKSRLRTGALEWGLYRDGETAHRSLEFFVVSSWEEHLRQHHERQTGDDRQALEQVDALSDPRPQTSHFLGEHALVG